VVEIRLRLFDIVALEFKFSGDEIVGGAELGIAPVLEGGEGWALTFRS